MIKKTVFALGMMAVGLAGRAAMRPTPDYLRKAVVYQVVLRNFTRDGNFRAATEMLNHVRSCGVDVVAFTRTLGARKMLVAANLLAKEADGGSLIGTLAPYACLITPCNPEALKL